MYQQKITLTTETRKVTKLTDFLGYEGENKINMLIFEFTDGFVEGRAKLVLLREDMEPGYLDLERVDDTYILPIKSALISKNGDITFCLTITNETNETIVKYNPFVMTVKDAPDTDIPMPEDYPTWSKLADDKLMEMDNAIKQLEEDVESGKFKGEKGDKGEPGAIKMQFLNELPETGSDDTLYFIPSKEPTDENKYDEYAWANNDWEYLGSPKVNIDLTQYWSKEEQSNYSTEVQKKIDTKLDANSVTEKQFTITYEDGSEEVIRSVIFND